MKTQDIERVIANKIADYWYKEIHGQIAPIFGKQKLRDFAEEELKKLRIPSAVVRSTAMKKKFVLKTYPQHFWHVADLKVYEDGKLIEKIWVNKFYSLTETWFFIYDEIGGSGTGWRQGDVIRKIYIGDAEFERK